MLEEPTTCTAIAPLSRLKLFFQQRDRRRTSDPLCDFGVAIKLLMDRYNNHHEQAMTDERLSKLLPVAKSNMSLFLRGERIPHHTLTEKMCDILGCSFIEKVRVMRLIHQSPHGWYEEARKELVLDCQVYIDLNSSMIRAIELGGDVDRITGPLPTIIQDGERNILLTAHFPPIYVHEEPVTDPLLMNMPEKGPSTEPLLEKLPSTTTSYTSTCDRERPPFTSSSLSALSGEDTSERPPS